MMFSDLSVLGIPPDRWADVLADSRSLTFDEWCAMHVRPRPERISVTAWETACRRVYDEGPLAYFFSTHVN